MRKFVTLLVEDDAIEREMLSVVLRAENYEVIECATAEAAELVVAKLGGELQALVIDQHPAGDMPGAELAAFARAKFSHMNVIVMSGRDAPSLPESVLFFHKPFALPELVTAVHANGA